MASLAHDALKRYLHRNEDYRPMARLAAIRYQFEAIHPFLDGNARIGRLLMSLLLVHWELLPLPLLCLSAYFERHRDDYYDLLLAVSERGAWREWVEFFLRGVARQARDASGRAKRLQELLQDWREDLASGGAPARLLQFAESLFESPVVTLPKAREVLGVTYHTAQRYVANLVDKGILKQVSDSTYGMTFVASAILRASTESGS